MKPPLVQLALDFPTIDEALSAAEVGVRAGVDILEAGTPLIVAQGVGVIGQLARAFPHMPILADYKTMDSGFKNVQITQREGGHYMTVCANASDETVKSAIAEGKKTGIKVVTDTIGVKDQPARARQCAGWGVDMIFLHFSADERRAFPDRDGILWIEPVRAVTDVPLGIASFGADDGVRAVRAGVALLAIGHPLFAASDLHAALADYVQQVKAA
jgi:3-hexulose-6-phosphate synthase/6-phospho-3-hexuloisomerase